MLSLRESHTGSSRALAALDAAIEAWTAGNTGDVPYPIFAQSVRARETGRTRFRVTVGVRWRRG
jgi:hypothetical protein